MSACRASLIGMLALICVFSGIGSVAAQDDELVVTPVSNAPGWITVYFQHLSPEGTLWYVVEREGGVVSPPIGGPDGYWTDVNLQADTEYRYRACAIPETGQPSCSEWKAERTMPAPGRPTGFEPPIITNLELTPDSIRVTWGRTGDYTKILARIDDDLGNHFQLDLQNRPNSSYTFVGLRSGALYRVILKGCAFSLNNGCGPWSPDVFVTTPVPPPPPAPPGKPTLAVSDYSGDSVSLSFSVMTNRAGPDDMFLVLRNGSEVGRVQPRGGLGGFYGEFVDQIGTRHRYVVCFKYLPSEQVCSDAVLRPKLLGEELTDNGPCVVILGGCEGTVDYGSCPGCVSVHPDTCVSGYVWREAFPGDTVCVEPWVRDETFSDNQQAQSRRQPGSDYCVSGYVWREARPSDLVCVTPETRARTRDENARANERRLTPR
jgi:hypothetical protein